MTTEIAPKDISSDVTSSTQSVKKQKLDDAKTQDISSSALRVKKLSDNATVPTRGSAHAAGYDLYR